MFPCVLLSMGARVNALMQSYEAVISLIYFSRIIEVIINRKAVRNGKEYLTDANANVGFSPPKEFSIIWL